MNHKEFIKTIGTELYDAVLKNMKAELEEDYSVGLERWIEKNEDADADAFIWLTSAIKFSDSKEKAPYWLDLAAKLRGQVSTSTAISWKVVWYGHDIVTFKNQSITDVIRLIQKNDYRYLEVSNDD